MIYKLFKSWIEKSKARKKKLGPWLKFWYDRKTQWATSYTSLSVDAVNLAEAGQSKYKKSNRLKRLKLYQGCVYAIGDSLLYSSRLKAMASQDFVGKGPSKDILDLRSSKKEMARIKDQFMTPKDLEDLFTYLGIKSKKKHLSKHFTSTPVKERPFLTNDLESLDDALANFIQDPKGPYTYKSPKIKDPFNATKPGRPKGSKKKKPNKNDTLSSESSIDASENESSGSPSPLQRENFPHQKKRGRSTEDSSEESLDHPVGRVQLRKRKRVNFNFGESENAVNNKLGGEKDNPTSGSKNDAKESDVRDEDKDENVEKSNILDGYRFACKVCNEKSKSIAGIRAHYIATHAWKVYEYSALMKQPHHSLINVTVSEGTFRCSCGKSSPDRLLQEEDTDFLGRQWLLIHRLVDPPHFQEDRSEKGMRTFPKDFIIHLDTDGTRSGLQKKQESVSSEDLSLPDIDKYARTGKTDLGDKTEDISEFESNPSEDDKDFVLDTNIEMEDNFSGEDEDLLPVKVKATSLNNSEEKEFKAKRTRTKDTKAYVALKRRARNEILNYEIELKFQTSDSFTFELKNRKNGKIYLISFGEQNVTCNCESFKEIEQRRWESANNVCKHVPIVTYFCHENVQDNYKGQRFFSTRSSFRSLSEMFKSFDPNRNLLERKKHANFFLYPTPVLCPDKKYPYFSKKDYALDFLQSKIKEPFWFAEKYNRESAQGVKPACKSCSAKIDIGKLCLRIDHTQVFQNRNYKKDEFTLKTSPIRVCVKQPCFTDINSKVERRANFWNYSNICSIERIDLSNVYDQDKITLKRKFKNDVTFVHDQ